MDIEREVIAQAELAIPSRQLDTVKFWLARLEGVKKGDNNTARELARAEGLEPEPDEDRSFAEKVMLKAAMRILLGFKGDGSEAFQFFGRRVELPVEDRGLLILANLTSKYILERSQWGTTALLLAGNQEGIRLEDVTARLRKGMGGILGLFQKLPIPIAQGETEEAQREIETYCEEVAGLWGDSDEALRANKLELDREVIEALAERISTTRPEHILEIQINLRDLSLVATGSLREAIENASQRLDQILATCPEILEGATMPLSPLGRILAFNQARETIQLAELPQSRDEIVQQTIEAATRLQQINYRALALGNESMLDQVRRRVAILRNVIVLVENHGGLYEWAQIRREETKRLKRIDSRIPIYDPRPHIVASVLENYTTLKTSGNMDEAAYREAMEGECYAAAFAILQELSEDWRDARDVVITTIESIQRASGEGEVFHIHRSLERDDVALQILGIQDPQGPTQRIAITQGTIDLLQGTLARTLDTFDIIISFNLLRYIFQGDKVQNDEPLARAQNDFLQMLRMVIR